MNRRSWSSIVAVAVLFAAPMAQAQDQVPPAGRFIRTTNRVFNRDQISHVQFDGFGESARAWVWFAGNPKDLEIFGADADQLRDAFAAPPSKATAAQAAAGSRLLAFDDFDGKLALNWKPVRPDASHVSLAKNPGKLTITTQRGSIHGEEKKDEYGEGIQAKNLYLIDNPLAKDADFVATTCVVGFTPAMPYQQAGLIVYDDDDNYLKLDYEFAWQKGEGQTFFCVSEVAANPQHHPIEASESGLSRYWLRLTKRGNQYEYATSTDGKAFRAHGTVEWGDGAPKRIGILAKNGGNKDALEADASFAFFDLRSPAPAATEEAGRKD
jgi:regulation of enolase protein 1 (concanavalin A-like superfamily)